MNLKKAQDGFFQACTFEDLKVIDCMKSKCEEAKKIVNAEHRICSTVVSDFVMHASRSSGIFNDQLCPNAKQDLQFGMSAGATIERKSLEML